MKLSERHITRNSMVTIGLKNVELPYRNTHNESPVMVVAKDETPDNVLKRFHWGRLDDQDYNSSWNMIIGMETSMIVVPVPVNKPMYEKFLNETPNGTPYEFVNKLREDGTQYDVVDYWKKEQ